MLIVPETQISVITENVCELKFEHPEMWKSLKKRGGGEKSLTDILLANDFSPDQFRTH